MENLVKWGLAGIMSLLSLLAPIQELIICAMIFIVVDFITGVVASYKRAKRYKKSWAFESKRMWNTVLKVALVLVGIVMAWLIDTHILHFLDLKLANLFTGFVCAVEMWSYLENAAEISQHPVFRWVGKFMKKKLDDALDTNIDEIITNEKNDKNGANS